MGILGFNMKTLKFRQKLSELVLAKEKDTTWRLFDDKDLSPEDIVSLLIWETLKEFSKARIISVKETIFRKLAAEDWKGHESFSSEEERYKTYSKYYNKQVTKDSPLKIIKFELI